MAVIKPFRGISYNRRLVKDPGTIITPPYDVIGPEQQEELYRKNPCNVIRLEYGKTYPQDSSTENRYTRAAATLRQWLDQGILQPDQARSYYFHEQSFQWQGQTLNRFGFFAALKLEPYSSGLVLPHELTMAGPKEDRYQLLKHTRANFSPIFVLFPDPERRLETYREIILSSPPAFEATDSLGQSHRLWAVSDPELTAGITAYLAERPVLIADGHHRYETAFHYGRKTNLNRLPGAGYVLSALIGTDDPGLLMLPAHRLVFNLGKSQHDQIERLINQEFQFLDRGQTGELDRKAFLTELDRLARESFALGYITPTRAGILVPTRTPGDTDLPITILHERLLNQALAGYSSSRHLGYTHDNSEAIDTVRDGKAEAAFLIGSLPVGGILERARRGLLMPQKSTYFYPKLPGGLILYHMELGRVDLPVL